MWQTHHGASCWSRVKWGPPGLWMPGQGISSHPLRMSSQEVLLSVKVGKQCFFTRRTKNLWTLPSCSIPEGDRVNVHLQQSWPPELAFSPILFLHSLADLVRGGQEPQPRAPLGERAGSCVAPLLKVDSWPRKVMALSNSERSGDEAASVGLRRHIQALAALERILETLYQILFCFLHRPLKETAATASKGTLSHHSPPMSCQEPVMAQVHPQHPSPSLGQSPSFPTCRQLSWGRLQAKAQGGQAANNLHTLVPYLVITTVQMPVEAHHLPCK